MAKYRIVVCCGANIATSTIAYSKLSAILKKNGIQADLIKCSVRDLQMYPNIDLIVSTTTVAGATVPVVKGLPLITGIGVDKLEQEVLEALRKTGK